MQLKIRGGQLLQLARSRIRGILILLLLTTILGWRLGSMPPGMRPAEEQSIGLSSLSSIMHHPLQAPYHLLQNILLHLHRSIFMGRATSLIIALIFTACFYFLLKAWLGRSIALLSTLLLVFTPYFLLCARSASPDIMYFIPILVLWAYSIASRKVGNRMPLILLVFSLAISLYVPGTVWLIGIMCIYRFSKIKNLARIADLNMRDYFIFSSLFGVLMLPLIIGFLLHPDTVKQWLLIPGSFPGPGEIIKSFLWSLSSFVIENRRQQDLGIGRLALLNTAQVALLIFGGYVMWARLRKVLLITVGLCIFVALLSGINNDYSVLALALPLLLIIVGMGLRYLFIEWRYVFPLNPIAKAFAIFLMSLLVLSHVLLGIRYSLVAWPATVAGKHSNVLK